MTKASLQIYQVGNNAAYNVYRSVLLLLLGTKIENPSVLNLVPMQQH